MTITGAGNGAALSPLVAAQIRAWMGFKDVLQTQLAARLGVTDQWLSMRLKGRTPIDLNELQKIADALEVAVVELLPATARERPASAAGAGDGVGLPIVMPGELAKPRTTPHRPSAEAMSPHLAHRHAAAEHSRPGAHAVRIRPAGS